MESPDYWSIRYLRYCVRFCVKWRKKISMVSAKFLVSIRGKMIIFRFCNILLITLSIASSEVIANNLHDPLFDHSLKQSFLSKIDHLSSFQSKTFFLISQKVFACVCGHVSFFWIVLVSLQRKLIVSLMNNHHVSIYLSS